MAQKVLVIDDESEVRGVISRCLTLSGYRVDAPPVEMPNASISAGKAALSGGYDLIILDFRLPHLDCIELTKQLQGMCMKVPIVLVAGFVPPTLLAQLCELGIARFLQKPFLASELLSTVQQALRGAPQQ